MLIHQLHQFKMSWLRDNLSRRERSDPPFFMWIHPLPYSAHNFTITKKRVYPAIENFLLIFKGFGACPWAWCRRRYDVGAVLRAARWCFFLRCNVKKTAKMSPRICEGWDVPSNLRGLAVSAPGLRDRQEITLVIGDIILISLWYAR